MQLWRRDDTLDHVAVWKRKYYTVVLWESSLRSVKQSIREGLRLVEDVLLYAA